MTDNREARRQHAFDTLAHNDPTTEAGRSFDHLWPGGMSVIDRLAWRERILAIEAEAVTLRSEPPDEGLREALARILDITKPFDLTMQGPRWFSGDTDIFGGGNREKVWRIANEALLAQEGEAS